jgi:5'-deoxynucleotidase YfbR-like HD superfamily hydrolase
MITGHDIQEAEKEKLNSYIMTYSGVKFYPFNPNPQDVPHTDIARALSKLNRYGGHTPHFFSVAEHAVHASETLEKLIECACKVLAKLNIPTPADSTNVLRWALHHDDSEAFLVDMPRPIKNHMPEYARTENPIQEALKDNMGIKLSAVEEKMVHNIDNAMLFFEKDAFGWQSREWQLAPSSYYEEAIHYGVAPKIEHWDHETAYKKYMERMEYLNG